MTNTIPRGEEYAQEHRSWLTILPADDMIAEAVMRDCTYGGSVSALNKKK